MTNKEENTMTQEQQAMAEARKARSIEILTREGIPFIQHLPLIEPEGVAKVRSQEEIARRAGCVFLTAVCSWNIVEVGEEHQREVAGHFTGILQSWGLWEELSQKEQALFSGEAATQIIQAATWRMEAFVVLAWALGRIPSLDIPRGQFQGDLEEFFPNVHPSSYKKFAAWSRRRPDGEILDEADLIYRIRWAAEDARINGKAAPAGIDADVALERHIALNWLIGYGGDDWDNISIDT